MRGLGIILSGTIGASVALASSAGYLPTVGPAIVRFQPSQSIARSILPPLQMQGALLLLAQTPDATTNQLAEPGPVARAVETRDLSATPTNLLTNVATNSPSPLPAVNSEDDAVISPQEFLHFFTSLGKGSRRETIVVTPPGFNPAQPGQPASSSATYTSPNKP